MLFRSLLTTALVIAYAGSAQAAVKLYDHSAANGTPGDQRRISINICPPITTTPGQIDQGFAHLVDNGTGSVTLVDVQLITDKITDLGPDILTSVFGPGAFIFLEYGITRSLSVQSNTSNTGAGTHGPSSTAPGSSTEWGLVTGWDPTGEQFCISSPVTVCNQNGFAHGQTAIFIIPSDTYNLGTWNFDASTGDYESATWYITRTSNGGLSNNHDLPRGSFIGASLPALPLVGFGALALGLTVIGGRALMGKK